MSPLELPKNMRITSPDKVAELLFKVAAAGSPLLIKAISMPEISVRGRALTNSTSGHSKAITIGSISVRGCEHLAKNISQGIQIEFVLASIKIVFVTTLIHFIDQSCVVNFPNMLESIERRKDARLPTLGNSRAYFSIDSWTPNPDDSATVPFFESTRDLLSLIPVGDVSAGGLSLVSRFPALCRILTSTGIITPALFHLPMHQPLKVTAAVRWTKKTTEILKDPGGRDRSIISYRFGVQLINQSDEISKQMRQFLASAAHAGAI